MAQTDTDLAGLIGSRICHDLVSPIGAIGNGIELMTMLGDGAGASNSSEMQLVSESCEHAAARIRFFRVAFGWAGDRRPVAGGDIVKVIREYTRDARLKPDWTPPETFERREAQLGCLAYLCFETAMPTGGRIRIEHAAGQLIVTATEGAVTVDEALWALLSGAPSPEDVTPAKVQFPLLAALARDQNRPVRVSSGDGNLQLTI